MKKRFSTHTGRVVALRRSNVDTDQIIPAEYCKVVTREGLGRGLFARWRADADFVLNRPRHVGSTIMIAGPNFGTGSSREHAVWALRDWGFMAVISARFGDIFMRNALRNGLVPVRLPEEVIERLMDRAEADPGLTVTVDLAACQVAAGGEFWPFDVDEQARRLVLAGRDEIDETLRHEADLVRYEAARPFWLPDLTPGDLVRDRVAAW
jgi:3-isopropylmalate/(R)-2-methylmalate dehydratase small subunit